MVLNNMADCEHYLYFALVGYRLAPIIYRRAFQISEEISAFHKFCALNCAI